MSRYLQVSLTSTLVPDVFLDCFFLLREREQATLSGEKGSRSCMEVSLFQALRYWGKTRKKKAREQLAGRALPSFLPLGFLNSTDPTISEPGTGYMNVRLKSKIPKVFLFLAASQIVFVASFRVLETYHNFISDPKNELSFLETEGPDLIIPSHHQPIKGQNTLHHRYLVNFIWVGRKLNM